MDNSRLTNKQFWNKIYDRHIGLPKARKSISKILYALLTKNNEENNIFVRLLKGSNTHYVRNKHIFFNQI